MKRKFMALGMLFITGSLYAACFGPYCYDDKSAYIYNQVVNGRGAGMPTASSTTINASVADQSGQEILCTTCVNAGQQQQGVCVSTAASSSAWVLISSTTIKCQ